MTLKMWLAFAITVSESEDAADPLDKLNNEHIAGRYGDEGIVNGHSAVRIVIKMETQGIF